ncbi:MAG: hypothetical protein ACI8RD_003000 [Bacillariaceae sp.]|jgi:hypothetical protein
MGMTMTYKIVANHNYLSSCTVVIVIVVVVMSKIIIYGQHLQRNYNHEPQDDGYDSK